MKQKTAILIAAALTAFVLAIAVGVTATLTSKAATTNVVGDPPVQKVEQASMPVRLIATPSPTARPTAVPQANIVSADRAAKLALAAMPGSTLLKPPELVNFKGKMAYEVSLSVGLLYIDAFTGKQLAFFPTPPSQPPQDNGGGGDGGGGGNQGEVAQNNVPPPDPAVPPASNVAPPVYRDDHEGEHEDDEHQDEQKDSEHQDQEHKKENKDSKHQAAENKKGGEHHKNKSDQGGAEGHED